MDGLLILKGCDPSEQGERLPGGRVPDCQGNLCTGRSCALLPRQIVLQ